MDRLAAESGDCFRSALAVAVIHALIGYSLLRGLGVSVEPALREAQQLIEVTLVPPAPQVAAPNDTADRAVAKPKDAEGAASPANLKNTPTEVVVPPPEILLPPPPSIPVARSPVRAPSLRLAPR